MLRWLAPVLALSIIAGACGNGGGSDATAPEDDPEVTVDVRPGASWVESVGPPVELTPEIESVVIDKVESYVRSGVVATLLDGEPEDLTGVFDPPALAGLDTESGAAMLDREVPETTGDVRATAEPVALVGLADGFGVIVLVTAALDLEVVAGTSEGDLTIRRTGDIVFAPDGEDWKVTAFSMAVTREGAGVETTEEAAAS